MALNVYAFYVLSCAISSGGSDVLLTEDSGISDLVYVSNVLAHRLWLPCGAASELSDVDILGSFNN